jgi:hypothetical protein
VAVEILVRGGTGFDGIAAAAKTLLAGGVVMSPKA